MSVARPALFVRNAVAALILAALDDPQGVPPLAAAVDAFATDGCTFPSTVAAALESSGLFESASDPYASQLRLRREFSSERATALERLRRGWRAAVRYRETVPIERDVATALAQAAALWEAALFFEVHEVLERIWREVEGDVKRFLQGLIQIAAALHHVENANRDGARALFIAGRDKIAPFAPAFQGVNVAALLAGLDGWIAAGSTGGPWPTELRLPELVYASER